ACVHVGGLEGNGVDTVAPLGEKPGETLGPGRGFGGGGIEAEELNVGVVQAKKDVGRAVIRMAAAPGRRAAQEPFHGGGPGLQIACANYDMVESELRHAISPSSCFSDPEAPRSGRLCFHQLDQHAGMSARMEEADTAGEAGPRLLVDELDAALLQVPNLG